MFNNDDDQDATEVTKAGKKKKRLPSNTSTAAVQAMMAAASPLPTIPSHVRVRKCDEPFLEAILRARTRDEWVETDLVVAAQLARTQADIERESILLDDEGSLIDHGDTQKVNPRSTLIEQLARRELSLMRSLRIIGCVATGDKRDIVKARKLQRQAEQLREELLDEDDDLLAK